MASLVPENLIDQKALWDMVSTPALDRYFYLLDLPQPVKVGYGTALDCQDNFLIEWYDAICLFKLA